MKKLQKKYSDILLDIIRDTTWSQWNRLGLNGTGGVNHYSTDVDAALIAAGYGSRLDGRLFEGVFSWIKRYGHIINGERLSTLIRERNDEWIARFLGALLENIDPARWRRVINQCKKHCREPWKKTTLLLNFNKRKWLSKDPVMSRWGILYDCLTPTQKLQNHNTILLNNNQMRCRLLYGTNIRADVIYLLFVNHNSDAKRRIYSISPGKLAEHLRCHHSTIYRVQKDLEEGGFDEKDLQFSRMINDYDVGIVNWDKINDLLTATINLALELEKNLDELILKTKIQDFQTNYFPLLIDHGVRVPSSYGLALGPLKEHTIDSLFQMVTEALVSFYHTICSKQYL